MYTPFLILQYKERKKPTILKFTKEIKCQINLLLLFRKMLINKKNATKMNRTINTTGFRRRHQCVDIKIRLRHEC